MSKRRKRRTMEAVRKSEEKYRFLYDASPATSIIIGMDGKLKDVSNSTLKKLGYSKDEVIGKYALEFVVPEQREKVASVLERDFKGEPSPQIDVDVYAKDGSIHTILFAPGNLILKEEDQSASILYIGLDVTERKKIEEQLRESEERYKAPFEEALDAIFIADAETGVLVDCNRAATVLVGREKSELVGKHQRILHPPEEIRGEFSRTFKQHLKEKEGQVLETRVITKKGEIKEVAIKANLFELRGRKMIQGIFRDITEQKRAEEALKESEEKYRVLVESSPNLVAIYQDGALKYVNKAMCERLGWTFEEMTSPSFNPIEKTVSQKFQALVKESIAKMLGGASLPPFEINLKTRDGLELPVMVKAFGIVYNGKPADEIILIDITERKRMEEELERYAKHLEELVEERTKKLREAERWAAIGETAAMVGHDLRNPLTSIAGAAYLLKTTLGSKMDDKTRESLELIEKNVRDSDKIVKDLLEYSGEIQLELTVTNPKSLAEEALSIFNIPENVRVIDLSKNEPGITVDVEKMQRVFVNLIKNAVEAMPEGGTLSISSRKTNGDVEVSFADTGIGMTKEDVEKAFGPFFTTKAKGLGLGLAISKRIVEKHGGSILVESTPGKGSTFTVRLPIKPELEGVKTT